MIRRNSKYSRGFTLIELMVVVAIVGILSVLAIFGVRKYLANAKTAEARNNLGQMGKDMGTAWEREMMTPGILAGGAVSTATHALCASPSARVPVTIPVAQKYQSTPADWNADQATTGKGFACLKFVEDAPQYYAYNFTTTAVVAGAGTSNLTAEGDLNGDGVTSLFQLDTAVVGGVYTMSPSLAETNPEE